MKVVHNTVSIEEVAHSIQIQEDVVEEEDLKDLILTRDNTMTMMTAEIAEIIRNSIFKTVEMTQVQMEALVDHQHREEVEEDEVTIGETEVLCVDFQEVGREELAEVVREAEVEEVEGVASMAAIVTTMITK